MRKVDLVGHRSGRLVVLKQIGNSGAMRSKWLCQCDCGKTRQVAGSSLRSGLSRSCGCLFTETRTKHGYYNTKTYRAWGDMRRRCSNPKNPYYYRYGERGIKVCERWQEFENFLVDMGEAPVGAYLDRKDNNGNYTPENCRWANARESMQNTSQVRNYTFLGQSCCAAEWARRLGMNENTIRTRLARWDVRRALTKITGDGYDAH